MQKRLKLFLLFFILIVFSGLIFFLLISLNLTKEERPEVITEQPLPQYSFYCHLEISEVKKILADFHFMKKTGMEVQIAGFFNSFFLNSNFDFNYLLNESSEIYILAEKANLLNLDVEQFIAVFRVKDSSSLSAVTELLRQTITHESSQETGRKPNAAESFRLRF